MSEGGNNRTHIRIRQETLARLRAFAERLNRRHVNGFIVLPEHEIDHTSLDFAIRTLLDRDERHFARMRRSRQRKASGSSNGEHRSCEVPVNRVDGESTR